MGIPVTVFEPKLLKIQVQFPGFEFVHQLAAVMAGVLFNSAVFVVLFLLATIFKKVCNCMPRMWYTIVCKIGWFTVLDPLIILIVDVAVYQDFESGDWFRFYEYYKQKEGNGVVGLYITIFMMFALIVVNGFLFYYYMVFLHQNGRILDLYKRLNGVSSTFFIPADQEVSLKYLQWVMQRVQASKKQKFIVKSENKKIFDKVG